MTANTTRLNITFKDIKSKFDKGYQSLKLINYQKIWIWADLHQPDC